MAKDSADGQSLQEIAEYQEDAAGALRSFFSPDSLCNEARFAAVTKVELAALLEQRLAETELRSCLIALASIEAAFRCDYRERCKKRLKDPLSRGFRQLNRTYGARVSLEEDLLRLWSEEYPEVKALASELRGALKFRHWLAHGRYWEPKLGRDWDFAKVYLLATLVVGSFPLLQS